MDRLFFYEKEYCEEKHGIEGLLIERALRDFCPQKLDKCRAMSIKDVPAISHDIIQESVPVGSLEFVQEFLVRKTQNKNFQMNPIEVPESIQSFICRPYQIKRGSAFTEEEKSGQYFVKDASALKSWNNALNIGRKITEEILDDHLYVVSTAVRFESEWRVFVFQDNIMGLECYQGEPSVLPNQTVLTSLPRAYRREEHPVAYTIDVGIRKYKDVFITEPLEVHPFVSVGLYGFYDRALPDMWAEGYRWYVDTNKGCTEHILF